MPYRRLSGARGLVLALVSASAISMFSSAAWAQCNAPKITINQNGQVTQSATGGASCTGAPATVSPAQGNSSELVIRPNNLGGQVCSAPPIVIERVGDHRIYMPQGCDMVEIKLWGGGGGAGDYHDATIQPGAVAYSGGAGGGASFVSISDRVSPGSDIFVAVGCGGNHGVAFEKPSTIIQRLGLTQTNPTGRNRPLDDSPIRLGLAGGGGQVSLVAAEGAVLAVAAGGGGGGAGQRYGAGGDGQAADQNLSKGNDGAGSNAGASGDKSLGHSGGWGGDNFGRGGRNGGVGTQYCGGAGGASIGIGGAGASGGGGHWGGGGGASGPGTCMLNLDGMPQCETGSGGGGGGGISFANVAFGEVSRIGGNGFLPGGANDPDWNGWAGIGGDAGMDPQAGHGGMAVIRFRNFTAGERYNLGLPN